MNLNTNAANTTPVAVAQTSGVGDFKITVNISSAHIIISAVGYYSKAVQTVHVHPVPGDAAASGTRLLDALAWITTERVVIQAYGGTSENFGIANFFSAAPVKVRDVQITVTGGSGSLAYGFYAPSSTTDPIRITNSAISVSSGTTIRGIQSDGATVEVEQSQVRAAGSGSYGIYCTGAARVDGSVIEGVASTVTASTATIGATRLGGGAVSATSATCAGVYDESYIHYASSCP